jgi:hypothetical protein
MKESILGKKCILEIINYRCRDPAFKSQIFLILVEVYQRQT